MFKQVFQRQRCLTGWLILLSSMVPAAGRLPTAMADVFHMPPGQASLQFVVIGDPGNTPDTQYVLPGYGAVGYAYQVGKFEVTTAQYAEFLNSVAAADTYGLYNPCMANTGDDPGCGIVQNGSSGSYTYSVISGRENLPVNYVSWGDAARFCNWLANGQPTGSQAAGTTETGSYPLNGATTDADLMLMARNPAVRYVIPTEDEWYKAAYYKAGSVDAGYWDYPTRSNNAPSNLLSSTGTNNANYRSSNYSDPVNYLTPVGAFAGSPGPYGTHDQGGNVYEWNETSYWDIYRGLGGGSFGDQDYAMRSDDWGYVLGPATEANWLGFRIANALNVLAGDANGDGYVSVGDLQALVAAWASQGNPPGGNWNPSADFNSDGYINVGDLQVLIGHWGESLH